MESEITAEEINVALAQTKPRKVTGPDGFMLTHYHTFSTTPDAPFLDIL